MSYGQTIVEDCTRYISPSSHIFHLRFMNGPDKELRGQYLVLVCGLGLGGALLFSPNVGKVFYKKKKKRMVLL